MVKNLRRLACKFDLDQSERKSSQHASRKHASRKLTQVFNLCQLASPFGQGLRVKCLAQELNTMSSARARTRTDVEAYHLF